MADRSLIDYPATLDVVYPEHLSRWLVLVKSWLLALPQPAIVSVLTASWSIGDRDGAGLLVSGGLLGLLVLVLLVERVSGSGRGLGVRRARGSRARVALSLVLGSLRFGSSRFGNTLALPARHELCGDTPRAVKAAVRF